MKKNEMSKEQAALDKYLRNQSQDVLQRYEEALGHANYYIQNEKVEVKSFAEGFGKYVKAMRNNQVMTIGTAGHEMLIYKEGGQYHFYDPNDAELGFREVRTADQVVDKVMFYQFLTEGFVGIDMDFIDVVVTPNEKNVIDPEEIFELLQGLLNKIREMTGKKVAGKEEPELVKENAREELQQFIDQNAGSSDMEIQLLMSDIDRALVYEQAALGQIQPVRQGESAVVKPFLGLCAAYFNTVYKPEKLADSTGVCYGLCMIFRELLSQTGSIEETSNIFYSQIHVLTKLAERISPRGEEVLLNDEEIELVEKVSAGTQLSMIGLFHASQNLRLSSADVSSVWTDGTHNDSEHHSQASTLPLSVMMKPPGSIERERALSNPIVIYDSLRESGEAEEMRMFQRFTRYRYNDQAEIKSIDGIDWKHEVSIELRNNKEFVLAVLRGEYGERNKTLYPHISASLKTDIDVVRLCIEKGVYPPYPKMYRYLSLNEEQEKECLKLYLTRQLSLEDVHRDIIFSLSFIPLQLKEDPEIKPLIEMAVQEGWFEQTKKISWEKSGDEAYVIENIGQYALADRMDDKTLIHPDLRNKSEVIRAWILSRAHVVDIRILNKDFPEVMHDIELQKQIVRSNPWQFRYADLSIQNDMILVKELVQTARFDMYWIADASKDILGNEEIMQLAIAKSPKCLKYASKEIRGQKEVVLAAAEDDRVLWYASDALKGDRELVLAVVQKNGHALQYASDALKGNRDIVLAAVRRHFLAVQYIDQSLTIKTDLAICKAWIEGGGKLKDIQEIFDSEMLCTHKNELAQCCTQISTLFSCSWNDLPESWREPDVDGRYSPGMISIVCKIIQLDVSSMVQIPVILQENTDIQKVIFKMSPRMTSDSWSCIQSQTLATELMMSSANYQHFSKLNEKLRNNEGFVLNLIQKGALKEEQCRFIGKDLMKDQVFCIKLVLKYNNALEYVYSSLKTDHEFWKELIAKQDSFLSKAPDALRDDKDYMAELIQSKSSLVEYASDRLQSDKKFMLKVVGSDRRFTDHLGSHELLYKHDMANPAGKIEEEGANKPQAIDHGTSKQGKP